MVSPILSAQMLLPFAFSFGINLIIMILLAWRILQERQSVLALNEATAASPEGVSFSFPSPGAFSVICLLPSTSPVTRTNECRCKTLGKMGKCTHEKQELGFPSHGKVV